jgi:hypothetical protein
MEKISGSGIRFHISESLETIYGLKILKLAVPKNTKIL